MNQKAFFADCRGVLRLFTLVHLLRILFGVAVVVHDIPVPMWASGIAVVVAGYLGYQGIRLARKATQ